jgi:hypothetical protein
MRSINLQMDGNQVCATWDNFDCLATSPAGFGDTIWQAFGRLIDSTPAIEINAIVTSIENAPHNIKELATTDSQQPQPKTLRGCQNCGNKFGEPCQHPCGKSDYTFWQPRKASGVR